MTVYCQSDCLSVSRFRDFRSPRKPIRVAGPCHVRGLVPDDDLFSRLPEKFFYLPAPARAQQRPRLVRGQQGALQAGRGGADVRLHRRDGAPAAKDFAPLRRRPAAPWWVDVPHLPRHPVFQGQAALQGARRLPVPPPSRARRPRPRLLRPSGENDPPVYLTDTKCGRLLAELQCKSYRESANVRRWAIPRGRFRPWSSIHTTTSSAGPSPTCG